jgi:hypothetical protein
VISALNFLKPIDEIARDDDVLKIINKSLSTTASTT